MTSYGIFADIAGTALALAAAATAIGFAWTKRAKWAPPEEAVPKGVARLASLGAMVALAAIFARGESVLGLEGLILLAGSSFLVALVGLVVSTYISTTRTFTYADGRRTLGGFRLTDEAAGIARKRNINEKQMFADAQGDHDLVWTRGSRAAVQIAATLAFIVLILGGTISLTAAATAAYASGGDHAMTEPEAAPAK